MVVLLMQEREADGVGVGMEQDECGGARTTCLSAGGCPASPCALCLCQALAGATPLCDPQPCRGMTTRWLHCGK